MLENFTLLDWSIFAIYGLLLVVTGIYVNRSNNTSQDYFLGSNQMSLWAVGISVLATAQSAATFLGGPDQGYRGNLTYLSANIASIIAAIFVAKFLIPKFYKYRVFTVYELLGRRFGKNAMYQAGLIYLFGRLFASGSRLFMAAIAISMILFGDIRAENVIISIVVIAAIGFVYTVRGGIRSVIYSDVLQCLLYVGAALSVLIYLLMSIPADFSQIITALGAPGEGLESKLVLFDFSVDFTGAGVFSMWSVLTGLVLLNIAAYGLDQDVTQRMLTCKDEKSAVKAMLSSVFIGIPVVFIFMCIGLLLFVYYQQPALMQSNVNAPTPEFKGETVTIFMYYVLTDLPAGLKAIVTIGIVAAALSTLNSGLNSMSSVAVQDIYKDWIKRGQQLTESHLVIAGRISMGVVAIALSLMAALCYYWQQYTDMPLLNFALSVMIFSYSGLLGVYFTALFTSRGSARSILFALIAGFMTPVLMQPYVISFLFPESSFSLGFTWQLIIGVIVSFTVCMLGNAVQSNWEEISANTQS